MSVKNPSGAAEIVTTDEIVAANLRYGHVAAPLRKRAYAQVVVKVFLSQPRGAALKVERIRQQAAEVIGSGAPTRANVEVALEHLTSKGMVRRSGKRYKLAPRQWDLLREQVARRRDDVSAALRAHFPRDLDEAKLSQWFNTAGARIFAGYGDIWVASVSRSNPELRSSRLNLDAIAAETAASVELRADPKVLAEGLRRFIRSQDPRDNDLLWHLGRAMFAARLMAADLASDPISARELAGSTLLLDTNVLISISLEGGGKQGALQGLGAALATLDIRLRYLYCTKEEYRRVVGAWRDQVAQRLERLGAHVLRAAADDHVRAAVDQGCVTREDFDAFYDTIFLLPNGLDGIVIDITDDDEVAAAELDGLNDTARIKDIQNVWLENRPSDKKLESARHDAAVSAVARSIRASGEKCWVVSMDRTMQKLAARWAGSSGEPLWITLDTLLQILAVEEESSGLQASAFAPLLSHLIANEVATEGELEYTVADLRWLDETIQSVDKLPPESIQRMALTIHRARMGGAPRDDDELRLQIERMYQDGRAELGSGVAQAQRRLVEAMKEAFSLNQEKEQIQAAHEKTKERLVAERAENFSRPLIWKARRRFAASVLVTAVCLVVLLVVAGIMADRLSGGDLDAYFQYGLVVFGLAAGLLIDVLKRLWPRYRVAIRSAELTARERAQEETETV